jgi:hypothetical protein
MNSTEPCILVKIPDKCYISPAPGRSFPFAFSFVLTYGVIPPDQVEKIPAASGPLEAVKGPTITLSGFERLLSPDKLDGFLKDLKKDGDKDWTIAQSLANGIVFTYAGDRPDPNFYFSASTEKFISDTRENGIVVLRVAVRGFDVPPDSDYVVSTRVDYTPWAKSLSFSQSPVPLGSKVEVYYDYMGDNVDKQLLQDGELVETARSPYTATIEKPSRFTLEVFNQSGILDRAQAEIETDPPKIDSFKADRDYFAEGEAVTLTWELHSVSTFTIDLLKDEEIIEGDKVEVHPQTPPGSISTAYTLRANGFMGKKPMSTAAAVTLTRTLWKNAGAATGFFAGDVYGNVNYNSRIVNHGGQHYCYAHPTLYQSTDGIAWTAHSVNDQAPESFRCIAADANGNTLYAMGKEGENGESLSICQFDFSTSKWTYGTASQYWASDIGGFSFSDGEETYAQTVQGGITLARRGEDGGWNAGSSVIPAGEGEKAVSGDYCFFKDRHYAVMLCEDGYISVYNCSEARQSVLFRRKVGKNGKFACFVQTLNRLYVMTGASLTDVKTQESADGFSPQEGGSAGRPWLGVDKCGNIFGLFPDKTVWTFEK